MKPRVRATTAQRSRQYLYQTASVYVAQCAGCHSVVDGRRLRRGGTVVDAIPTEDPGWREAERLRVLSAKAAERAAQSRRPRDRVRARALRASWLEARERAARGGQLAHTGCGGTLKFFDTAPS